MPGPTRICLAVWVVSAMVGLHVLAAQEVGPAPLRFEVQINGENFLVDEGRITPLESKNKPGVEYEVAVWLAQYQPWRLNRIGFNYHRGFAVTDDQAEVLRTATLKHDLGFAMVLSDLGGALDEQGKQQTLEALIKTTRQSLETSGAEQLVVSAPSTREFGDVEGRGVTIAYQQGDTPEAALVYVLTTEDFSATVVVQYLEKDQADVLDLIRPTWRSLRLAPEQPR